MSFLTNLPDHIRTVNKRINGIRYDMSQLEHECNCDLCGAEGEVSEFDQPAYDELERELLAAKEQLERLKWFAAMHKVDIEVAISR